MAVSTQASTGARGGIVVGEEDEYGTAVAPTHILDFNSESISASENIIESEAIRNDRGRSKLIRGSLDVGGDITFEQSASGYGMILRHALGDYVKVAKADGGFHARLGQDALQIVSGPTGATNDANQILVLSDETSVDFGAGNRCAFVYRDPTSDDLAVDDDTAAGYAYEDFAAYGSSYINTAPNNSDTSYAGAGAACVSIVVEAVNGVNLDFNSAGGLIRYGDLRTELRYFQATDLGAGSGVRLYLDDTQALTGDPATYPANGDTVISLPCITFDPSFTSGDWLKLGTWVYLWDNDYTGVYTHHIERGRALPIGLTIEVDRDAVVFLYTGCKVNTLTLNFETNSIVTGTLSVVGKREYSTAKLLEDVNPGDTSILIETAYAVNFPDAGTLTIYERTGITYTGKTDNGDGTTTLTGIPASGIAAIDRHHTKDQNVDPRTSTQAGTTYQGITSPMTSFETLVYIENQFEEAIAGSVTLNNNLNTDKFGLGDRFRLQLVEQRAVVEASITFEFDDGKHYNRFHRAEFFPLEFRTVSTADDSEIGETGVLSQAYYFMPKCKFTGTTPVIESDQYIEHEMPCTCVVDTLLDTTDLVIILVNGLSEDVEA